MAYFDFFWLQLVLQMCDNLIFFFFLETNSDFFLETIFFGDIFEYFTLETYLTFFGDILNDTLVINKLPNCLLPG